MEKADKTNYQTLSDFARLVGVHRTTVLAWVKNGKIISTKKYNSNKWHRLNDRLFYRTDIKRFLKPYPKYSTPWSETEIYILRNWTGTDAQLAKAVGRSINAVRIRRSRLNTKCSSRYPGT